MNDGKATQSPEATVLDTGLTIRQYYVMVGIGAFVTTLAQPAVIGRLPFSLLLKTRLHFNAETLALFMFIATFAWNVKPIAGILSDSFPLLGTRRRHYMLFGAGLAALCWFLMGVVPTAYWPLLLAAFGANAFMVISSTVMGGLMVEAGRKYGISGRITSIRQTLQSAVSVSNGLLGGYLATMAFGWIVGIATGLLIVLTIATFFVLTERPAATRDPEVLRNAGRQFLTFIKSKSLWAAGGFLALVYVSPGFTTPLLLHADRKARLHPAVHRVDGNDRRRGRPRRRRALWRRLPAVQPATAPDRIDCGQRPRHAALPHLRTRRRPIP